MNTHFNVDVLAIDCHVFRIGNVIHVRIDGQTEHVQRPVLVLADGHDLSVEEFDLLVVDLQIRNRRMEW